MDNAPNKTLACDIAAWILITLTLLLVFPLRLLSALISGLLVYELVHLATPLLRITKISRKRAKLVVVSLLAALIVTGLAYAGWKAAIFFRSEAASVPALLNKLASILEDARGKLPVWVSENLPESAEDIYQGLAALLRRHASAMQEAGKGIGLGLAHILIGMILGAMVSLHDQAEEELRPLAAALYERVRRLGEAFRTIVFAQVRISAINTLLTFLYLVLVLPTASVQLPLVKTMLILTFFAGLLPVVGNLISNSVIVVVSLSVSFSVAAWSLLFLVLIHKLEYFLNARIIGSHIQAKTWELLLVMLFMESAFGLAGLVAAPIYYAYVKKELRDRGLV